MEVSKNNKNPTLRMWGIIIIIIIPNFQSKFQKDPLKEL